MKKLFCYITVISTLGFSISCNKEDITGKDLRIICEELRPYSYVEDNQLKGISADITARILDLMAVKSKSVEVPADWSAAYDLLRSSDNVALFTTGLTAERKEEFQWVGPITMFSTGFIGLRSSGITIGSVNDAMFLSSIGVVKGYPTVTMLQDRDFKNLIIYNTQSEAVTALYAGLVTSVFDESNSIRSVAAAGGHDAGQLSELFTLSSVQGFIAFSKGVSPIIIESWQEKLDELKESGFVQDVYNLYLPGVKAPGVITIYTEENPPQNFRASDGTLTGSSVEIVNAMSQGIPMNVSITIENWTDAYEQVQFAPNSMIFSTVRTPARESLFHWIGPVCRKNYCFFVNSTSAIDINIITDAKQLTAVGVPQGWAAEQELKNQGFTNIHTYGTPLIVFQKLLDHTIDAAVLNDIAIPYLAEQSGHQPAEVRNELVLSYTETSLAFSLDTKDKYIQQWEQAYATVMSNGKFAEIWGRWYPGIKW
jgi:polar amino acid transport system substrate-binding protein